MKKYKIRFAELAIYECTVEAKNEEEAQDIFNDHCPDDATQVDVGIFDGGGQYDIYDVTEVTDEN